jgi:choline dehydrogenase-like flavoprotein
MTDGHYDVIIIGTGARGGTLAWKLAPAGKKILLIERGDYVRRERAASADGKADAR